MSQNRTTEIMDIVFNSVDDCLDVCMQDQHSPIIIANFTQLNSETTNTVATAIDDRTITLTDITNFVDGVTITIFNPIAARFSIMKQIGAPIGNVVTIDTPLDLAYPIGSFVTAGDDNLNVDGSITPQIFALRNTTERTPINIDITRLIFTAQTDDPISLPDFGDIAGGLLNGIVLRKVDGTFNNIFNVKSNSELLNIMFDFEIIQSTNPAQGQDGFIGRLTFAGQDKIGVTIRIEEQSDLQLIIQDDLTQLIEFKIKMEGHIVED